MAALSRHYGLKGQLEFLDVDVSNDNRLFLDPHAIRLERGPSPFARQAHKCLTSFFDEIVRCVLSGSKADARRGLDLLQHFTEPKETRLGLSKKGIDGHGGSDEVGTWIWRVLSTDARALIEVGVLKQVEHMPIFVEGVDKDITSDVTTRIVFESLAKFTRAMVRKYPEFRQGEHEVETVSRPVWSVTRRDWINKDLELPVAEKRPLLLVPKYWARPQLLMFAGRYYETAMLSFVQEQLGVIDRKTGKLIKPPKDALKANTKYKRGRETIVRVTGEAQVSNEDLVDRYRAFVDRKYERLDDDEISRRLE